MTTALTRPARRRLKRLVDSNEPVIEADRRFFQRFPHRTYRVRRMSQAEIGQSEIVYAEPMSPLPPGRSAFTIVKQLAPGVRLRAFIPGPDDEDGGSLSDTQADLLWQRNADQHPDVRNRETMMREAIRRAGGPSSDGGSA